MPIATTLPASNVTLRFPPSRKGKEVEEEPEESYQLLELPPEILKAVEKSDQAFPLTIKGTPSDDAVLCTPTSTFLLRTITISNSLLVCRTPSSGPSSASGAPSGSNLEIRGIEHQVLECMPQAADLERIRRLLKDSSWEGMTTETGYEERARKKRKVESRRWTRAQLESVVQASSVELERGLKERNVIEVDGHMLMLSPVQLRPLLTLVLTFLTIHATTTDLSSDSPYALSPTKPILDALSEDHDVPKDIVKGVMDLLGIVQGGEWRCDLRRVVGEVGKGLIATLPGKGKPLDRFLADWKEDVGESWSDLIDIKLLEGNYLLNMPPVSTITNPSPIVTYFPLHTLPLHPPTRFADLFLTRQKWRPEEMTPFLAGLTREGDKKELDKLIVKFVRVVKDKEGTWWFPRRTG